MPAEKSRQTLTVLQYIVLTTLILYVGKTLFIPFSFALLVSFLLYPICRWLEDKGIYRVIAIAIPVLLMLCFVVGMGYLLIAQLLEFSFEWANVKAKLLTTAQQFSVFLAEKLGLSAARQAEILENVVNNAGSSLFKSLGNTVSSFSEGLFLLIMVPIFSFLILLYRHKLANALYQLFPAENRATIYEILTDTIQNYYNFIKGMLLVYLTVGILNSIGLAIIGVPHPVLFGFIASVLTFIPYIGIMTASLLPITVAWVTYNSIWYPVAVIGVFAFVQFLEAYLIFPLAVGKRLKLNTLVVFVVIILGGMLWGAAGMILFIPMVSILKLIADKSPKLHYLSDILGE